MCTGEWFNLTQKFLQLPCVYFLFSAYVPKDCVDIFVVAVVDNLFVIDYSFLLVHDECSDLVGNEVEVGRLGFIHYNHL